jgi:peptidyl-prolyl cis-trans isomerase D
MLQNIREGIQGPWAIAIVALIVVSFVFTGVGSYISSNNSTAVAIVNGVEIEEQTLETAYQNERARLEGQFGDAINQLFASESYINQFRGDILQRLINEELVSQKALELGLRVSDAQIREAIVRMPEFQLVGQFDNDMYNNTLARAGFTPSEFAEYMRVQLTRTQLENTLRGTGFSLQHQVDRVLALREQTRDAQTLEIDIAKYQDTVTIEEADVQSFYDENITNYDTQEQVKLAYVTLSVSDIMPSVEVTDEEVRQYYQDNQAVYTTEEERRISHILFETIVDEEQARAKAEEVLAKLEQGEDFAALAEEFSDDVVSAEIGGDLDVLNPGDYSPAFEDAAFAIAGEGEISGIVETEFGLHIIKVTELTPAVLTPFEDVQAAIKNDLVTDKATEEFFSLQQEMDRLAFEEIESLDPVANAVSRPVIETDFFEAGQLPPGINYPQVADVAFSSELIDEGVNSTLLELTNELVMVVRVADHKPKRTMALDEVRASIESELKIEKAQTQALAYAQEIQNAIFDGLDQSDLLAQQSLSWTETQAITRTGAQMPQAMVDAIFALDTTAGNNTSVVTLTSGNIGVVKLNAVNAASVDSIDEAVKESTQQSIANSQGQQTYQNFIDALRDSADVQLVAQ